MQLRRFAQPIARMFLTYAFTWLLSVPVPTARAQDAAETPQAQDPADPNAFCGSQAYLDALPVKPPQGKDIKRQVQLINCSDQILLGAAGAARAMGQPPWPVFPQEGTWVMQPFDPKNPTDYSNVLTVDIPPEWYGQHVGGNTPNFWARTGCRYDPVSNRAQCETGSCSGQYDCSSANLTTLAAATIVEWTFYQHFPNTPPDILIDSPDISAVNGANLTVDVSPRGGSDFDPINGENWHWLNWNYPLTVHGKDLREPTQCVPATGTGFKLTRSAIDKTIGRDPGYPLLGYVTVDANGNPTMPTGNYNIACLSNCAKFKFPTELGFEGCNPKTNSNCYFWNTFCAGDPKAVKYGQDCKTGMGPNGDSCETDEDCVKCNGGTDFHVACFKKSGPNKPGTCELRGFFKGTVAQCNGNAQVGEVCGLPLGSQCATPTNTIACTNTYGSINPLAKNPVDKYDYNDQPIVAPCSSVTFNGTKAPCIGEDTLHQVLHGAYTWPNDPQVYSSDATVYRIVFSPQGRGQAPITPAQPLPACDDLPSNYKPSENRASCSIPINGQNADFAIAKVRNQNPNQWQSTGKDWPCAVGSQRDSGDGGIVCAWNPLPEGAICQAPKTDTTYVPNSACGRIDSGTSLVSGSMTPKSSGDPLLLEVSIPSVLNNVSGLTSISGCVPASGMGSWSRVALQTLNSNQGVIAFYKGTSNTSLACNVTVTLANSNPAELKLYDVPKFNGTLETMSTASGTYANQAPPYIVSAGTATTRNNDLQLGALLQVDQVPAPITYWENWLSNGADMSTLVCLDNNNNCPRDDGPDYLPGHGPYSGNSDVGHNMVAAGTQYFYRRANIVVPDPTTNTPGSSFSWVGLAIYLGLNP